MMPLQILLRHTPTALKNHSVIILVFQIIQKLYFGLELKMHGILFIQKNHLQLFQMDGFFVAL